MDHDGQKTYTIGTFAAMVGLPQSMVRFYERSGLLPMRRRANGYRYFLPEDAFRMNAFRVLRSYGFSVDEAVRLLEEKQSGETFRRSLVQQRERLMQEQRHLQSRMDNLDRTIALIVEGEQMSHSEWSAPESLEWGERFAVVDCPDYLFVRASNGRDFSVSTQNAQALAEFVALMPATRYLRIIRRACFETERDEVDPDYICGLPIGERQRLKTSPISQLECIKMGRCLRYTRRENRENSVKKETFDPVYAYLHDHGYKLRGDMLIMPTFLNLDGNGEDIEFLYVPIS